MSHDRINIRKRLSPLPDYGRTMERDGVGLGWTEFCDGDRTGVGLSTDVAMQPIVFAIIT